MYGSHHHIKMLALFCIPYNNQGDEQMSSGPRVWQELFHAGLADDLLEFGELLDDNHSIPPSVTGVPFHSIAELLINIPWGETKELSSLQIRSINEGLEFLELAIKGKEMAQNANEKGIIIGSLKAIHAYNTVNIAIKEALQENHDLDFLKIVSTAKRVLSSILEMSESGIPIIPEKEYKLTVKLFQSLWKEPGDQEVLDYINLSHIY